MKTLIPFAAVMLIAVSDNCIAQGWFQRSTGARTPATVRKIAPNGINFNNRVRETQSNLGGPSGLVPDSRNGAPASRQRMQNNGYRKFNDVQVRNDGRVYIGGQLQQGRATSTFNPKTKQTYWNYNTNKGGRVVKQSNGSTWVRPGPSWQAPQQQKSNFQTQRSNSNVKSGKNLGTFNIQQFRQNSAPQPAFKWQGN